MELDVPQGTENLLNRKLYKNFKRTFPT